MPFVKDSPSEELANAIRHVLCQVEKSMPLN